MMAIDRLGPMLPGTPDANPLPDQHINVRGYKRARPRIRTSAHARRTDPETSHLAAASITGLTEKQSRVLEVLEMGPACDEETYDRLLERGWRMSPSGARTRRAELVDAGKVEWAGTYVTMRSGRKAMVWQVIFP